MSYLEFWLKWSAEGRAWVTLLMPVILSGALGIHLPQPQYMKKSESKNANSPIK